MTRRLGLRAGVIGLALLISMQAAIGQFPRQNIPPAHVPDTAEPPLADPKTVPPTDMSDKARQSIIGSAPARGITPLPAALPDPPTPVVSIHVTAPASVSAGADLEYTIVVENKSQAPAHHVKVSDPIPAGVQFVADKAEPIPTESDAKHVAWELGTLKPGETKTVRVTFRPLKDGLDAIDNTARVQFEHGQRVRTILKRPQLVVTKTSLKHALEGSPISCALIVENTGEVDVTNIDVHDALTEGLHFEGDEERKMPVKSWTIPLLAPKQTRTFNYNVIGEKAGAMSSHVIAKAERGAIASFDWKINVGPSPLTVKIVGPKQIYLNYPASYQISVRYTGNEPLDNVVLSVPILKGMKIVRATPGSQSFRDRVQWPVARLNAGEPRNFNISVEMANAGTTPISAQVLWHGPTQTDEVTTEFLGAVALHLHLQQSNNPVRVGEKVRYSLTVTNNGSAPAKGVKLIVTFPVSQLSVDADGTDGKQQPDRSLVIDVAQIAPKEKLVRQVTLKATAQGSAKFHVEMESAEHLPAGNVTKEEVTTITE